MWILIINLSNVINRAHTACITGGWWCTRVIKSIHLWRIQEKCRRNEANGRDSSTLTSNGTTFSQLRLRLRSSEGLSACSQ